ncbi:uncharacterized protein MELLADRAFT_71907 [Melampsora larici-populina 98AG31]|uniref:Uncharacterized protein n=1 Tax=Melampsora larici-populina (strain 98AG31 / pathotype 3-4-7) TaxID=747676 RepID=F4RM80_MELLP|nr:uncharacterized protein MELLADRAFT_71907 [Melampsora larici-populina 98AG31]EGG06513.1 hypothetical protein MELLADRAFT_71907 [Melampsora larici-populina 98AG31]
MAPNVVKLVLSPAEPIDDWEEDQPAQHVYKLPQLVSLEIKAWCEDLTPRFQYCEKLEKLHTVMNLQRHSNWEVIPILVCANAWPKLNTLVLQNSSEHMIKFFTTNGLGEFCNKHRIELMT